MNSIEWKNATPAQHNLWKNASALIAYNDIQPLFYFDNPVGSEFLTRSVDKIYICLEFFACSSQAIPQLNPVTIYFYDNNGGTQQIINNFDVYYQTGYKYNAQPFYLENFWFGQLEIAFGSFSYIKFNGYRLSIM
jgi:hypothetical protein